MYIGVFVYIEIYTYFYSSLEVNLENSTMNCLKPEKEASLLHLPEELIRVIFSYLTDSDVYFRVRLVCRQLQIFSEKYVQIGKNYIISYP